MTKNLFAPVLSIVLLLICCPFLKGQENDDEAEIYEDRKLSIHMVPQYMLKNGFRVDAEYFLDYPRHSLVAAPLYYFGYVNNNIEEVQTNDLVSGFGIELIHKYYLGDNPYKENEQKVYFGHGPYFRQYKITYDAFQWQEQTVDGLDVVRRALAEQEKDITKYGYSVMFGANLIPYRNFLIDLYAGMGIRGADITSSLPDSHPHTRDNSKNFFDYGYRGPVLVLGMKLGVLL